MVVRHRSEWCQVTQKRLEEAPVVRVGTRYVARGITGSGPFRRFYMEKARVSSKIPTFSNIYVDAV